MMIDERFSHQLSCFRVAVSLIMLSTTLSGCVDKKEKSDTIIVSIQPLKYIVERITCGDFPVDVFVPPGASPETYSLTPSQMASIEKSPVVFVIGLIDFETELMNKVSGGSISGNIIPLYDGIQLIEGAHAHSHGLHAHHTHSIDPHVWTSSEQLMIISRNVYKCVKEVWPDSVKYAHSYEQLITELEGVSKEIESKIEASPREYFLIYHPALTYYAREYGIEQVALEDEGKEPSAIHIKNIIEKARADKMKYVLYQKEFARSTVEALANDIGATSVEIDPLAENITEEMLHITDLISE